MRLKRQCTSETAATAMHDLTGENCESVGNLCGGVAELSPRGSSSPQRLRIRKPCTRRRTRRSVSEPSRRRVARLREETVVTVSPQRQLPGQEVVNELTDLSRRCACVTRSGYRGNAPKNPPLCDHPATTDTPVLHRSC